MLYVGEPALRMQPSLRGARFSFSYELRDLRDLDGDGLLRSEEMGDNVLAVLANLRDRKSAVTEIVRRIAGLDAVKRDAALGQLIVLAGLRGLEETVEEEIRKMPILNDIMDHKVLGREYKRGRGGGDRGWTPGRDSAGGIEDTAEASGEALWSDSRVGGGTPRRPVGGGSGGTRHPSPGRAEFGRVAWVGQFWGRPEADLPTKFHVELSPFDQILNCRILQILGPVNLDAECVFEGQ